MSLSSSSAVHWCAVIAAIGVTLSSAESISRPDLMSDTALGSWQVARLNRRWQSSSLFRYTAGWTLTYPTVIGLVVIRFACALAVAFGPIPVRAPAAASIVVISIMLTVRTIYGHDGSDEMITLVYIAAAIAYGVNDNVARELSLWFLAGQASLAYLAAGVAKAASPIWRSGAALPGIMSTNSYGSPIIGAVLTRNTRLSLVGCWAVILGECCFPLTLLGVWPLTIMLLFWGASFHVIAAIFMRLNTFVWAFLATYPAILFCAHVGF